MYKIKKKGNIGSGRGELLIIKGVTPRTKIRTLEKKYKADYRSANLKEGTATLFRYKKKR